MPCRLQPWYDTYSPRIGCDAVDAPSAFPGPARTKRINGMDFDGRRPVRTTFRLLAPGKWRLALATLAFVVKDSPIWLLPLLTANIIDVVVQHRPIAQLWLNAGVLAVILLQ